MGARIYFLIHKLNVCERMFVCDHIILLWDT